MLVCLMVCRSLCAEHVWFRWSVCQCQIAPGLHRIVHRLVFANYVLTHVSPVCSQPNVPTARSVYGSWAVSVLGPRPDLFMSRAVSVLGPRPDMSLCPGQYVFLAQGQICLYVLGSMCSWPTARYVYMSRAVSVLGPRPELYICPGP